MRHLKIVASIVAAAAGLLAVYPLSGSAQTTAEGYPKRPITMIVPFPPGVVDGKARIVAEEVGKILGQPIVVENKSGAGQRIGTLQLARAQNDGYTIGVVTQAGAVMAPVLDPALKYDPLKDFRYLTLGYSSPLLLLTHPGTGFKTLGELVAAARAKPGALRFGSSGLGTAFHVWTEALLDKAGVEMLHVPYRGAAQAQNDLISGQIALVAASVSAKAQVESGHLVALATTGAERSEATSTVPTVKESGVDFVAISWLGFAAPAGIPEAAARTLDAAFKKALATPEVIEKLRADGSEVRYTPPEEFTKMIRDEIAQVRELNKKLLIELR